LLDYKQSVLKTVTLVGCLIKKDIYRPSNEEILRNVIASFKIEGIEISYPTAKELFDKILLKQKNTDNDFCRKQTAHNKPLIAMHDTNDTKTPNQIILNQLRASGGSSRNTAGLPGLFL